MVYVISRTHSHVRISRDEADDKEVWTPVLQVFHSLDRAIERVMESRTSRQEWSKWFELEWNEGIKIWYVYVTWNWGDGTKSFQTWRIDGMTPQ